ncbi:MAG: hypothetical protein AAF394_05535 [Planctomycetota bacterium]
MALYQNKDAESPKRSHNLRYRLFLQAALLFAAIGLGYIFGVRTSRKTHELYAASGVDSKEKDRSENLRIETDQPSGEPFLQMLDTYRSEKFAITLTEASVGIGYVRSSISDLRKPNASMNLTFRIQNLSGSPLPFAEKRNAKQFLLRNDAGETIREESFPGPIKPLKALDWKCKIPPGPTVTHVKMYDPPPPDSEFFTVEANLECLGLNRVVLYRFPATSVAGYQSEKAAP